MPASSPQKSTPRTRPGVVDNAGSGRLRGAPTVPQFSGFAPIDLASLPLDPITSEPIVGRVNGTTISLAQLSARLRRLRMVSAHNLPQPGTADTQRIIVMPGIVASTENEALMVTALINPAFDSLVDSVINRDIATSHGIRLQPLDIEARVRELNSGRTPGNTVQDELFAAGRALHDLREDLETQDMERQLFDRTMATEVDPATTGQLQAFLQGRPDIITSPTRPIVRARHIAIPLPADAPEAKITQSQAVLEQALSKLMGGTSWSVAVGRYSMDNLTRRKNGDLGWIDPADMDPGFRDVLRNQPILAAPQIVRTARGMHLVQVTDRQQGDGQLHWRRNEATNILRDRRAALRKAAKIERYIP